MKLTIEAVVKGLSAISINFTLEASEAYQDLIFSQLKNKLTDEEFKEACLKIITAYPNNLYGKMPPVAMFLKYAGKQELSLEQQAEIETNKIINYLSQFYYPDDIRDSVFDCPQTNTAVNKFGGLIYIFKQLAEQKNHSFFKKELAETWLNYYHSSHHDNICKGSSDFSYGIGANGQTSFRHRKAEIVYVGEKCDQKVIEQAKSTKDQGKVNLLISNLFKNGKEKQL